jgi:hypothetical protein
MTILLLIAAWLAQGIPLPPSQTGTVTGVLKTETGTPAIGVRVGAMAKPDSADAVGGSALVSIAETDASGRFRLENIPQGRYYITAGRVDFPTYYPGTQLMATGAILLVKAGETVSGIDFVLNSNAVRPPNPLSVVITPTVNIPIEIIVTGGGKIPIYSARGFAALQMTRISDGAISVFPLASSISLAIPSTTTVIPEYRIALQNLPQDYRVASIVYGTTPITNDVVRLNTASLATTGATTVAPLTTGGIPRVLVVPSSPPQGGASTIGPTLTITLAGPPRPRPSEYASPAMRPLRNRDRCICREYRHLLCGRII